MTTRALQNSLNKYPEGTIIIQAMIDELIEELMKEVTPWIMHNYKD